MEKVDFETSPLHRERKIMSPKDRVTSADRIDVNPGWLYHNNEPLLIGRKLSRREQIFNVLSTTLGTEPFAPGFGSRLPERVFDPMTTSKRTTDSTLAKLEMDTIVALTENMKGVIIVDHGNSSITADPENEAWVIVVAYEDVEIKAMDKYEFTISW